MNTCKQEACERNVYAYGWCHKHWHQVKNYGQILLHTRFSKNEVIDRGDYCELILRAGRGINYKEVARTKIDKADLHSALQHKWTYSPPYNRDTVGYVVCNKLGTSLHRFIMSAEDGRIVDHINLDKMDNRRNNLRYATYNQNCMNIGVRRDNKTGTRGVCWKSDKEKWKAYISLNGKQEHIGYYENIEDAVDARKRRELELYKEFSPLSNEARYAS